MSKSIIRTDFNFPGQKDVYHGKVRDVYNISDDLLVMIATDRISAFDIVLPEGIPYKGQVLNQIASKFLDLTSDIVPNWKIDVPDSMVTVGRYCNPYPVEMIIRGYLTGSSWRAYKNGEREICGVPIPDGMKEHERFPEPIVTPTTKATEGHDENISKEEIIAQGMVPEQEYELLEKYTIELFKRGTEIADNQGLILVDTKYEFGNYNDEIYLIDEIHTPDSSRYFYKHSYQECMDKGLSQKQLSKEFVREWLMEQGFKGEAGQELPEMNEEFVKSVSDRYIELYEKITGDKFIRSQAEDAINRVEQNINTFLKEYQG